MSLLLAETEDASIKLDSIAVAMKHSENPSTLHIISRSYNMCIY